MADDEPERPDLEFAPMHGDESKQVAVLTVNQLVAYNLMRARRRKAWTQQEAAERLNSQRAKKWTAATLSAAERSWQTGRSKQFDANELVAFAAVYECPLAYFFVPIKPEEDREIWYALAKVDEAIPFPIVKAKELLDVAVPLRYPSALIDEVNELRRLEGLVWSPSARVDWYRPEEDWSPDPDSDEDPWEAYQEHAHREGLERSRDDRSRIQEGKIPSTEYLVNLVMSRLSDSIYRQAKEIVENLERVLPQREGSADAERGESRGEAPQKREEADGDLGRYPEEPTS